MLNPEKRVITYYEKSPGRPEQAVGTTSHPSITDAAITVFSCEGDKKNQIVYALCLAKALNAARITGVPENEIREAFQLGEIIGNSLVQNPLRRINDRVVCRSVEQQDKLPRRLNIVL